MSHSDRLDQGMTVVVFAAEIKLTPEDVEAGEGSLGQAVQNVIGHTGAAVMDVEDSWQIQ